MPTTQTDLIDALLRPEPYPHPTAKIRLIETHISWVILTGSFAYKIKKAIKLPFLDFSSLDLRERYCRDELELNRRLAPEMYRDIVPIAGPADQPRVGAVPAIEFAVKMTQFPPEATGDHLTLNDGLNSAAIEDLAQRLADFHRALDPVTQLLPDRVVRDNVEQLTTSFGDAAPIRLSDVSARLLARTEQLSALLKRRAADGFVRECHGDLHLGNIALIRGQLMPFDCLEFDRRLRSIDVIDEVAFLFMDLSAHGRLDLAVAFLNRYLEATGDYAALPLLRYYVAHRALVRLKVRRLTPARAAQSAPDADSYLALAQSSLTDGLPVLVITCGLSGSGKTTIARRLAARLGAIHIRSDVVRKQIHGLRPLDRSDSAISRGIYDSSASAATYDRLAAQADASLGGGMPTIADASFLTREHRDTMAELAASHNAPFFILHCAASESVLRQRIQSRQRRQDDPSEADESVLDYQLATADLPGTTESANEIHVDTEQPFAPAAIIREMERRAQVSLSSTSY